MNVHPAKNTRIPTTAVTGLIIDAMMKAGVAKDDAEPYPHGDLIAK